MSVSSLQQTDFSKIATLYFQGSAEPEDIQPLESVVKDFDRNRVRAIREIAKEAISNLVEEVRAVCRSDCEDEVLETLRDRLKPGGSFGKEWLCKMYELGLSNFNSYIFHHRRYLLDNTEELDQFCQFWLGKVKEDFQRGELHSFYQMSEWMRTREICSIKPLSEEPPFDHPTTFLPLLEKMARLGISKARQALSWAYEYNELGEDEKNGSKIQLRLQEDDRIKGLKILAQLGDSCSGNVLGNMYMHPDSNRLGPSMNHLLRVTDLRREMDELVEIESRQGVFFRPITFCYANGKVGELQWRYTLEERIERLTERAKKGDKEAFSYIWNLYAEDSLEEEEISIDLNEEERWAKLEELRTEKTEKLYRNYYTRWIVESSELLPCRRSIKDRLDYLDSQILEEKNTTIGAHTLIKCYTKNSWEEEPLNIAFEERLEKLKALIYLSDDVMLILAKHYIPEVIKDSEVEDIHQVPEQVKQALQSQSFTDRFNRVFDLALRTKQWWFITHYLVKCMKNITFGEVLKLAGSHLEFLHKSDF